MGEIWSCLRKAGEILQIRRAQGAGPRQLAEEGTPLSPVAGTPRRLELAVHLHRQTCYSTSWQSLDLRPLPLCLAGRVCSNLEQNSWALAGVVTPVGVMGGRPGTGGAGTGSTLAPDGMEMPDALAELTAAEAACKHHY